MYRSPLNILSNVELFNEFSEEKYFVLAIDGIEIGRLVDQHLSSDRYCSLVPVFLDWLTDQSSKSLVWHRAFPNVNCMHHAPILMCSEDADLWCDLLIAKVIFDGEFYIWEDLGFENGCCNDLDSIGNQVDWLNIGSFKFLERNYKDCINMYLKH
jgi:hypothetical protein